MARFDVYENTGASRARAPFLLDVQNDFLQPLATRIVIPLVVASAIGAQPSPDVCPMIELDGKAYYLFTTELAAVPLHRLKPAAKSLVMEDRAKVQNALDKVFGGY